jgi:magnesium-transporting ATPase (P-type)
MSSYDWMDLFMYYMIWCIYCLIVMEAYCESTEKLKNRFLYWFLILTPIVNLYVVIQNNLELRRFKENEDDKSRKD